MGQSRLRPLVQLARQTRYTREPHQLTAVRPPRSEYSPAPSPGDQQTTASTATARKKRKEPVRLRALMLGYNSLNVCISLFVACSLLFFKITSRGFDGGGVGGDVSALSPGGVGGVGGFVCNPLRTDVQGQRVARVFAVFYLQKYLELVDTFLFVLRRSFRQVFLDVLVHTHGKSMCSNPSSMVMCRRRPFRFYRRRSVFCRQYCFCSRVVMSFHLWCPSWRTRFDLMLGAGVAIHRRIGHQCGQPAVTAECFVYVSASLNRPF